MARLLLSIASETLSPATPSFVFATIWCISINMILAWSVAAVLFDWWETVGENILW